MAAQDLNTIPMFGKSNTWWNRVFSSTEAEKCHKVYLLSQPFLQLGALTHDPVSPRQTHPSLTLNWKQSGNKTSPFPEAVEKVPVLMHSVHYHWCWHKLRCPSPVPMLEVSLRTSSVTQLWVLLPVTYRTNLVLQSSKRFCGLFINTVGFCCL